MLSFHREEKRPGKVFSSENTRNMIDLILNIIFSSENTRSVIVLILNTLIWGYDNMKPASEEQSNLNQLNKIMLYHL